MTVAARPPRAASPAVRRGVILGFFCALVVAAPGLASAQDQAFKNGMVAYDRKEWETVVKLMRAAVQADQQESPRKVEYGGFIGIRQKNTEYLPYYYLGEALYRMQPPDCVGAVDAWAASEKQGVVQKRPDLARSIQDGFVVCRARGVLPPSEFDPQVMRAQQQYTEVNALASAITALGKENPEIWRPDVRQAYEQATTELDAARQRIMAAGKTRGVKDLNDATAAIERARVTLTALNTTVRNTLDVVKQIQASAREAEQALGAADALREQFDSRIAARPAALTPAIGAVRQRAQESLTRGRERYAGGTKASNQNMLVDARSLGQDAQLKYRQLIDDLDRALKTTTDRQLAEARTGAAQAMRFVDELFTALDTRMAANPALAGEVAADRDAARTQADTVRRRIESVVRGENVAAIVQATRNASDLRDRLNTLTAKFGPLTLRERGVSAALEAGAAQFFAGRYQEALQRLNPAEGFVPDDPLQLHVHLFRAASLYALYGQSRESKPELRAQALAEIGESKKIDSSFQPDPRAFSPRFIALYRDGTGTAGGDPAAAPL
jgi:tetratricopeptide (TPR) repeat protein